MSHLRTVPARLTATVTLATAGVLLLGSGTAFASPAAPADKEGCSTGALSPSLVGSPAMKGGAPAGEYLGHGSKGWTLRVSHPGTKGHVFTGTIVASAPIHYTAVKLEKDDTVKLSGDSKTLTFVFHNYGGIDGINFTDSCAKRTTFRFSDGGRRTAVEDIWLGAHRVHPTSNPFAATRG